MPSVVFGMEGMMRRRVTSAEASDAVRSAGLSPAEESGRSVDVSFVPRDVTILFKDAGFVPLEHAEGLEALEAQETAWRRADENGDPVAARMLGIVLAQRGDVEGAEAACRRADERGDADGATFLGLLLAQREDFEGAEAAFRHGDDRGDHVASRNLGVLLADRGDFEGAEAAYRHAERRNEDAALRLGNLLARRGDFEGAEAAWRRSDGPGITFRPSHFDKAPAGRATL